MTEELRGMYSDFIRDALVETAIEHATKLAKHFGDRFEAECAWSAVLALKALRRPEVAREMDKQRLAEAKA